MPDQSNLDPQAAVDAVLGGATTSETGTQTTNVVTETPKEEPLPTLEPLAQNEKTTTEDIAKVEPPKVEAVPTELVGTAPVVPVPTITSPSIDSSTTSTSASTEEKVLVPSIQVEEPKNKESLLVRENTPLAFVGMSEGNVNTTSQVVPTAVIPTIESTAKPKKKKKIGIVVGGILFLVIALGGGIWGYNNYAKVPQIAKVWTWREAQEKREEHEANLRGDGYQAQINANQAAQGGYAGGGTGANSNTYIGSDVEKQGQVDAIKASLEKSLTNAVAAGGSSSMSDDLKKKYDLLTTLIAQGNTTGMNAEQYQKNIGDSIISFKASAAIEKAVADAESSNSDKPGMYQVDPSNPDYGTDKGYVYIQAPGVFEAAVARAASGDADDLSVLMSERYGMTADKGFTSKEMFQVALEMMYKGYTWVPGGVGCNGVTSTIGGVSSINAGSGIGVDGNNVSCTGWHFTICASGTGMQGIGCTVTKTKNERGEEIYITTDITPTMSCTGITKSPSAPTLGSTVTLTCAGTVTPSTAGTLSYKFRYNINGGAYTALSNATATTATLSIAACGTYGVQCQACATLNGVLTCDPTWSGATTQ